MVLTSQVSHALLQFRNLVSEKMTRRRNTRENESNKDAKRESHNGNESENEDNKDKLSDLPDCVLLHILSFLNIRNVVRTCVLSTRWKYLWNCLPALTISSDDFRSLDGFTKFVYHFLSLRDSSTALKSLDFHRRGDIPTNPHFVDRIITYAVSHNVNCLRLCCYIEHIPLFSCQSLTSLELGHPCELTIFPNSLDLPALTYLKLRYFSFFRGDDGHVKPFFTFGRLNTLILYDCIVLNKQPLCISNTRLLNLNVSINTRIHHCYDRSNLKIELSAPNLSIFAFTGNFSPNLGGCHFSSIKHVSFDIYDINDLVTTPLHLLNLLIEMTHIKSLTVSPRTLQVPTLTSLLVKLC